jgi:hypothetical protein
VSVAGKGGRELDEQEGNEKKSFVGKKELDEQRKYSNRELLLFYKLMPLPSALLGYNSLPTHALHTHPAVTDTRELGLLA